MLPGMKTGLVCLVAVSAIAVGGVAVVGASHARKAALLPGVRDAEGGVFLPNGWRVTPAGRHIPLPGDMPLKMQISPDGTRLIVLTAGFHNHGIDLIDLATEKLVQTSQVAKCWAGLAVDSTGSKITFSGADVKPHAMTYENGSITGSTLGLEMPQKGSFIAGMTYLKDGSIVAVDLNKDSVVEYAPGQTKPLKSIKVRYRPYSIAVSPNGTLLAVSNWGDGSVEIIDAATFTPIARTKVGSHPNELVFDRSETLYVANSGSNTVSVVQSGRVVSTIFTAPRPSDPVGSTPDAVALTPDGSTLFVANADNNDVAVVNVSNPKKPAVKGFIPTGWYPSALAVSPDGKRLFVGVGKGLASAANAGDTTKLTLTEAGTQTKYAYIGSVLSGAVSVVDIPNEAQLAAYTSQSMLNMDARTQDAVPKAEADDIERNALRKIKHVVYVIRENRTYDQVFGDISGANGDPSLTLFGEKVTPNAHKIAREWTLLDNLYCNGEVSQDGHRWCDSAYDTDFNERAWVLSYSQRHEPDADERLDVSPAGFLWDNCAYHGKSFYSYGENADFKSSPTSAPVFDGDKGLKGHASAEWVWKDHRDYELADIFIHDLKVAEAKGNWPQFMVMSLGEDHTSGLKAGSHTPWASVASNDFGLGKMVDAVSRSKYWKDTAFFVIEDDAQDGPDHVDAHRTVGLVISPYVKRHQTDSAMYSTASMVRTIEMILGLPAMTQYDAHATPMLRCFTTHPDFTPYDVEAARIDLDAVNPAKGSGARLSARLDLSGYDRADPQALNAILWHALKPGVPMPAPVHSTR